MLILGWPVLLLVLVALAIVLLCVITLATLGSKWCQDWIDTYLLGFRLHFRRRVSQTA